MDRVIRADQLDFSERASTPVYSDSLRFVLPVPVLEGGGELLVRPDGAPFTDRNGAVIEGRGVVFFDGDDNSWEVARGDGTDVIVFSPVTEDQGARLAAHIASLAPSWEDLTLEQLKQIVRFGAEQLGIASTHNSSRAYVAQSMQPADGSLSSGCGLHRRVARDLCRAVHVAGAGTFLGPAASPQRFSGGVVIVKHPASVWAVQCRSFETTYKFADGRPARVAELPTQTP